MPSLQARKLAVNDRLLLCLHDAVFVAYEQHTLQPFVLAVVSEVFSVPLPIRVYEIELFLCSFW